MAARDEFIQQISYLRTLEENFNQLLSKGENKRAAAMLEQIIEGYSYLGAKENVKRLFTQYSSLLKQFNIQISMMEKEKQINGDRAEPEQVLRFIEALEKKVKRRLLQGKTKEAVTDLRFIISKLRELHHYEKADLLENTLNQYLIELSGTRVEVIETPQSPKIEPIHLPDLTKKSPISIPNIPKPPNIIPKPNFMSSITPKPPPRLPLTPTPPPRPSTTPIPPPRPSKAPTPPPRPSTAPTPPPRPSTTPTPPPRPSITPIPPPIPNVMESNSLPTLASQQKPASTIKDLPLSEEELVLKKLFDIKDLLSEKK